MIAIDGVKLAIGGEVRTLRMTWGALIALCDLWGADFEQRVIGAIQQPQRNLPDLAVIIAVCEGHTAPLAIEEAADAIKANSPVINHAVDAIQISWNWAHQGFEASRVFAEALAAKQREEAKPPAKKSLLSRLRTAFATLTRTRSPAV